MHITTESSSKSDKVDLANLLFIPGKAVLIIQILVKFKKMQVILICIIRPPFSKLENFYPPLLFQIPCLIGQLKCM